MDRIDNREIIKSFICLSRFALRNSFNIISIKLSSKLPDFWDFIKFKFFLIILNYCNYGKIN
jgi:hypothetical protein